MVTRRCGKCDTVWRSELSHCAFCGQEGIDQNATAVAVLPKPANGVPKAPATPAPVRIETPAPAPKAPEPAPVRVEAPVVAAAPPLAPRLPSANVPILFAILGLAAAALLPLGAWVLSERVASVLVFLGVALLAPFGPLAWWTGARYATRCDVLGFRPAAGARTGHALGAAVTFLLAAEGSALAFLQALRRLQE